VLDRIVIKNFILYGLYQAIRLGFPLVVTPFLAHVLAKDGFSDFAILNSCVWTSTVFMEFGFYLYGVNKSAAAPTREDLREVVASIAASKFLLSPFALAIYLVLTISTGVIGREPVATAIGAICALGYGSSFAWFFQGQQKGMTAVLTEAVPQIGQLCLLLLFVRSPGDLWLVMAFQMIPPLASLGYAVVYLRRDSLIGRVSRSAVITTLKGAWPFFVERFCYSTYTAIMPSLIVLLSSKSEVAYYSIGDRFSTMIVSLAAPMTSAVMPRVAKAVDTPDGGWKLSWGLVAIEIGAIVTFAAAVFIIAPLAIEHFFSADYAPAILVSRAFCVTACFAATGFALANFVLIPRDRAKVMIWSSTLALIFGVIAQVSLIPRWGATGAAFGRMVSEGTVAVVLAIAAWRLYQQRPQRAARLAAEAA
jgi:O-antigen/teichoic acid export membrane protein